MLALLSMARNYRPNWCAAYVLAGERGGVGWFGWTEIQRQDTYPHPNENHCNRYAERCCHRKGCSFPK
jgi:hypothetical protein